MYLPYKFALRLPVLFTLLLALSACGGGGGGGGDTASTSEAGPVNSSESTGSPPEQSNETEQGNKSTKDETAPPLTEPWVVGGKDGLDNSGSDGDNSPQEEEPGTSSQEDSTSAPPEPVPAIEAARFLSQATFGPSAQSIEELQGLGYEGWLLAEFAKPASLHLQKVLSGFPPGGEFLDSAGRPLPEVKNLASHSFWETTIEADDQLRQRMTFALSQILVVSNQTRFRRAPQMMAQYMDILTRGAFGNYRDLLEEVTYSTAMGNYLTYLGSGKKNPANGRVPDENYAREILQLFTVGLVELQSDGTPVQNPDGSQVEIYDNQDITELAKVFTGLSFNGGAFGTPLTRLPLTAFYSPLQMFDNFHSPEAKNFLGTSIPAGTSGQDSIDLALDAIFNHPNVGPFIGRQVIQRFVTSAPSPAYVARVATAFDSGRYQLPGGDSVGAGQRGDLGALIAAVLFDDEARSAAKVNDNTFGKLREPVLRFTHWARAFEVNSADASNDPAILTSISPGALGQQPFMSPSVFNFYRPGYIAAGTQTGAAGLTAPELQITNASSIVGYPNFLLAYAFAEAPRIDNNRPRNFVPDYGPQLALAAEPAALLDNLDLLLTHGTLQPETRARITEVLDRLGTESEEERLLRVRVATVMVMSSPEYIVLR